MQKCYATKRAKVSEACIYLNLIQWATLWHKPESNRTSLRADTNFTLPRIYLFCLPRQQPSQTAITNVFTVYFLATFVFTYQQKGDDTQIRGCRARNTSRHELTQDSINEHECRRQINASISGFLRGGQFLMLQRGRKKIFRSAQSTTRINESSSTLSLARLTNYHWMRSYQLSRLFNAHVPAGIVVSGRKCFFDWWKCNMAL